jgi:hypothetical protein
MPKYRVLEKSFINNTLVNEGDIVDYEGDVHDNLELIVDAKPPKKSGKVEAETEDQT